MSANAVVASSRRLETLSSSAGTDGLFLSIFIPAGTGGLCEPQGLTYGPDGNLYVASGGDNADGDACGTTGTDAILKFDGGSGAFIGPFVTTGTGGLTDPVGLVFGPDGNLYVASEDSDSVAEV